MKKIKSILSAINNWFNRFIQKGGEKPFLEYLIKYLMACGIGFNVVLVIVILMTIFG